MKQLIFLIIMIGLATFTKAQSTKDSSVQPPKMQVTFFYPIGTGGINTINEEQQLSVNIIAGTTAGIDGLEVGGLANFTNGSVRGAQISGSLNFVRDSLEGFQFGGLANVVMNNVDGLQVAGLVNATMGNYVGGQVAGFSNFTAGSVTGSQISGYGNIALGDFTGFQASGFTNFAGGFTGTQASGFINTSIGRSVGYQLAGFANVATKDLDGAQISGFVNVAHKIKGVQIGFFNYADTLDGVAVGFLSYAKNGYHVFELSANETFQTNLTFKTGTNRFYNSFSAGIHWDPNNTVWALGYGIGARMPLDRAFSMSADLRTYLVMPDAINTDAWLSFNKLELSVGKSLGSRFELFAGGSINLWLSDHPQSEFDFLYSTKYSGGNQDVHWVLYPGFHGGLRW